MLKPEHAVKLDRTIGRAVYRFHRALYQMTRGRVGHRLERHSFLLLTTTGRRSGKERTAPLMTFRDDDRWVVVASNGGRDEMPAWYLNLAANPDVRVQVGDRQFAARAHVLDADERAALWPRLTAYYGGWSHYETLTDRPIPVVALVPAKAVATDAAALAAGQ